MIKTLPKKFFPALKCGFEETAFDYQNNTE